MSFQCDPSHFTTDVRHIFLCENRLVEEYTIYYEYIVE